MSLRSIPAPEIDFPSSRDANNAYSDCANSPAENDSGIHRGEATDFLNSRRREMVEDLMSHENSHISGQWKCFSSYNSKAISKLNPETSTPKLLEAAGIRTGAMISGSTNELSVQGVPVTYTTSGAKYIPTSAEVGMAKVWASCSSKTKYHESLIGFSQAWVTTHQSLDSAKILALKEALINA